MARPAYQATGTAAGGGNGPTYTPVLPVHIAGDVILIGIEYDSTIDSYTTPSGWDLIATITQVATTQLLIGKRCASSSETAPTFATPTNHIWIGAPVSYRGCAPTGAYYNNVVTEAEGGSAATSWPGFTSTHSEMLFIFTAAWGLDNAGPLFSGTLTNALLTAPVERYDGGTVDGNGGGIFIGEMGQDFPLAIGSTTCNKSTSSNAALVALALIGEDSVEMPVTPNWRATGTVVNTAGPGNLAVPWPGSMTADQFAILSIETPAGVAADLAVAGVFTLLGFVDSATASNPTRQTIYIGFAGSTTPTQPEVTFVSDHIVAHIDVYQNVWAVTPIHDSQSAGLGANSTAVSMPGLTTTKPSILIVEMISDGVDTLTNVMGTWANANLAMVAERVEARTGSGNGGGLTTTTGVMVYAGATGNTTATAATSTGQAKFTIALQNAPLPVTSDLAATIGDLILTAEATMTMTADLAVAIGAITLSATADVEVPPAPEVPDGILPWIPAQAAITMHWQTVVTRVYDATERRVALASRPFEEFDYQYQLSDDDMRYLRMDLSRAPAARRLMVMMGHELTLAAPVLIGGSVVTVGTTALSDCLETGRDVLLIRRDTRRYHYAKIAAPVTATTITLDAAVVEDFPAAITSIYPLAECTLTTAVTFQHHPVHRTVATVKARRYYVDVQMGTGAAALTMYDGRVVLDFRDPAVEATYPAQTEAAVDIVEFGMAAESYFADPGDGARGVNQREVILTSSSDAMRQRIRLFLATVVGRQKAFLLPTLRPDLVVAVQPTTDEMTVEGTYYSGDNALLGVATYEHLMITLEGGSTIYRTVVGAVDNLNGTETLTLNADVDTGVLGDVVRISFLELVRLASDEVPWALASGSGTRVSFPIMSCVA